MTAEESNITANEQSPEISSDFGTTLHIILDSIKAACLPFQQAMSDPRLAKPLNEDKLTQILVQQIEFQIRKYPSFAVDCQYVDVYSRSQSRPDFYFYITEEGAIPNPLFVVESKRLPSQTFETEYVIGETQNGGIERFKLCKHGNGLTECGMIGFVEKETASYWSTNINQWIRNLSRHNSRMWNHSEVLNPINDGSNYSYYTSTNTRLNSSNIKLHHIFVGTQN